MIKKYVTNDIIGSDEIVRKKRPRKSYERFKYTEKNININEKWKA